MHLALSAFIAFAVTLLFILLLRPVAIKIGLVDYPGGRKVHQGNIPLIGGLAMFVGFSFAILTLPISLQHYRSLLAACLVLIIAGVLDDFHELSARQKMLAQIVAVFIMMLWGKVQLVTLGQLDFSHNVTLGYFAIPFTLFAVVGVINAMNMIDGLDGLAGGLALIQLIFLSVLAIMAGRTIDMKIMLLVISTLVAFLIANLPYASNDRFKIFMGDAGSMFLGLVIAWFCVKLSQGQPAAISPVTMLWIVAVPLFDSISAIIRRVSKGLSPFYPDKAHLHHVFLHFGFSKRQTLLIIYGIAFCLGLAGVIMAKLGISQLVMLVSFIVLFTMYLYGINAAWKVSKTQKKMLKQGKHRGNK